MRLVVLIYCDGSKRGRNGRHLNCNKLQRLKQRPSVLRLLILVECELFGE